MVVLSGFCIECVILVRLYFKSVVSGGELEERYGCRGYVVCLGGGKV